MLRVFFVRQISNLSDFRRKSKPDYFSYYRELLCDSGQIANLSYSKTSYCNTNLRYSVTLS